MPKPKILKPQEYPTRMFVTADEMRSLAFTNRWHGHINYPYSVLTHQTIGAKLFLNAGFAALAAAFMLHDYEEAVIVGDVRPKEKKKYLNKAYRDRVKTIRERLSFTYGVNLQSPAVKGMDALLLSVEWEIVAYNVRKDGIVGGATRSTRNWWCRDEAMSLVKQAKVRPQLQDYRFYQNHMLPLLVERARLPANERALRALEPAEMPRAMRRGPA